MRLTDLDIEACLDDGTIVIASRLNADAICGVSVDVKFDDQFSVFQGHTVPPSTKISKKPLRVELARTPNV